jgi:hypothetical protein
MSKVARDSHLKKGDVVMVKGAYLISGQPQKFTCSGHGFGCEPGALGKVYGTWENGDPDSIRRSMIDWDFDWETSC